MGQGVPILAFGDSLFAGYGLQSDQSYPARLEAALRARGINARIANAGVSGNTTADGLARLAFTLDGQKAPPVLALVELGANDMLRALPPEQARANLDAILTELGKRKIPVVLMGMLAPPNLGADYRRQFDTIYPALAKKHGAVLVPFFMQPVFDKPALVQQDHLHPTAEGVEEIVAATVDTVARAIPKRAP
jgi:acyl-CoA thioesterase-1